LWNAFASQGFYWINLEQEVAMKKLLLASVIAVASAAAMIAPANADSGITIGIGNGFGDGYYDNYRSDGPYYGDRYVRRHYQYAAYDNGYRPRYHRYHRRCHVELVRHWRHHHRVVEEIRVCER
jgi:hypothetical protein